MVSEKYEIIELWVETKEQFIFFFFFRQTKELAIEKIMDEEKYDLYSKLKNIHHNNLVEILDVGIENGKCVVIEEFVNGVILNDVLRQRGKLSKEESEKYICELCDGLSILHRNKIIHRDVNPNNIMITNDGILKLGDYHISIQEDLQEENRVVKGTEGYIAPEQISEEMADERSDIYAVGMVLDAMLGGYKSGTINAGFLSKYARIITRATALEKKNRYPNVLRIKEEITGRVSDEEASILKIIRSIPGFRTLRLWKILIACIAYPMLLGENILYIRFCRANLSVKQTLLVQILLFVIPYILYTNCGYIEQKLPVLREFEKRGRRTICITTALWMQVLVNIILLTKL